MGAEEIIQNMSLRQKAAMVCGKDFWHSGSLEEFGYPSLTFSDGPHGLRFQNDRSDHLGISESSKATCFPTASALANTWDPKLCGLVGRALGREAANEHIDVLLGPGINIIRNPKGGRNFEYFSEDPYLTGTLAEKMVEGIQNYTAACPKHFLLNSQETGRMYIDERADDVTLHEIYLPAFKRVIERAKPEWIMTAYNKIDGEYACQSEKVYNLLKKLGFHGAVVTDWGGGCDIVKTIQAGGSLEMPGTFGQSEKEIIEAVQTGRLLEKDLDQRVLEVLNAMDQAAFHRLKNYQFKNPGSIAAKQNTSTTDKGNGLKINGSKIQDSQTNDLKAYDSQTNNSKIFQPDPKTCISQSEIYTPQSETCLPQSETCLPRSETTSQKVKNNPSSMESAAGQAEVSLAQQENLNAFSDPDLLYQPIRQEIEETALLKRKATDKLELKRKARAENKTVFRKRSVQAQSSKEYQTDQNRKNKKNISDSFLKQKNIHDREDFIKENGYSKSVRNDIAQASKRTENKEENEIRQTKAEKKLEINYAHHHILAREAAAASMVLLENDGILPLNRKERIAWIGPWSQYPIQGSGSSKVRPFVNVSFHQALMQAGLKPAEFEEGYRPDEKKPNLHLEKQAIYAAMQADVIVFLSVLPEQEQLEGLDRQAVSLPDIQVSLYEQLLRLKKPVILVYAVSGPVEVPDIKAFSAVVYAGLAGQGSLEALMLLLAGRRPFTGRLAQTFAISYSDYPNSKIFPETGKVSYRPEGKRIGYRGLEKDQILYPFGYGKSNIETSISDLSFLQDGISFKVINNSDQAGCEVLQIYIQKPFESFKELKGYTKIQLKPYETKEVFLPFESETFKSFDPNLQEMVYKPGLYRVSLGLDSLHDIASVFYKIEGLQTDSELSGLSGLNIPSTSFKETAAGPIAESRNEILKSRQISSEYGSDIPDSVLKSSDVPADRRITGNIPDCNERLHKDPYHLDLPADISKNRNQKQNGKKKVKKHPAEFGKDTPIHALKHSKSRLVSIPASLIVKIRNRSLSRLSPNMLAISLYDMPLKGLPKISGNIVSEKLAENILEEANQPSLKNKWKLIRSIFPASEKDRKQKR